jgi:hypothetical protein
MFLKKSKVLKIKINKSKQPKLKDLDQKILKNNNYILK